MPGSPEGRPLTSAAPEEERPSSKAARLVSLENPSGDACSLELAPQTSLASVEARSTRLAPHKAAQENVETMLAPWLVPGYKPPGNATPAAKTYANKVATLSKARPRSDPSASIGHSESANDDPIVDMRLDHRRASKTTMQPMHRVPPPSSLSASNAPSDRPSSSLQGAERLGMQPPVEVISERQLHERARDRPEYETDSSQRTAAEGKSFANANSSIAEVVVAALQANRP